jgi:hypothetical protein
MFTWLRTVLVTLCLQGGFWNGPAFGDDPPFDKAKALAALKTSKDALYLQRTAIKLIETNDPAAISQVVDFLHDPDFLGRLEPKDDPESCDRQRIQQVLKAIGRLGTPAAEGLLLKLAQAKVFKEDSLRMLYLIGATAELKKPSKETIALLNAQVAANEGKILTFVVFIFLHQAQPETLAEVERHFLSPEVSRGAKESWITCMLLRRHNLAILQLWERLLKSDKVDAELRNRLVQGLFDFQEKWFGPQRTSPLPLAPDRKDAPSDVLRELRKLADLSLKLDIPAETKAIVEKSRKEIDDILAKRGKK